MEKHLENEMETLGPFKLRLLLLEVHYKSSMSSRTSHFQGGEPSTRRRMQRCRVVCRGVPESRQRIAGEHTNVCVDIQSPYVYIYIYMYVYVYVYVYVYIYYIYGIYTFLLDGTGSVWMGRCWAPCLKELTLQLF